MSMVTNYILTCGPWEDDEGRDSDDCPAVNWINKQLRTGLGIGCAGEFARVDQHAGGGKAMEHGVFLCAMNYGRPMDIVPVIERAPWRRPEGVRLFVCEQEDEMFEPCLLKIAP